MYVAIVFLTATIHFAFLIYLLIGGFIAVRWRRTIWAHLVAILWAAASITLHPDCPLTHLEQWARHHAGMSALPSAGFIAHYLTGVVYPASCANLVEALVLF